MSTSDRAVLGEAIAAATLTTVVVALVAPDDVWLSTMGMHPAWVPVIVLAARYGARGLIASLAFAVVGLALASMALGGDLGPRQQSGSDLLALAAATLVGWIAMAQQSRVARIADQLRDTAEAYRQAEGTVQALHESLGYLRKRHDRLDVSLGVWRDIAARVERGDPGDAARALLELCELRVGAGAGVVQVRDGNRLTTVASRGLGSPTSTPPRDIAGDLTVRAAIIARRVTIAPAGATEDDSDVAAPVIDEDSGVVLGVIALRGVTVGALRAAGLGDLSLIAQWLAPALSRSHYAGTPPAVRQGRQP